jgi:hypothetical protein
MHRRGRLPDEPGRQRQRRCFRTRRVLRPTCFALPPLRAGRRAQLLRPAAASNVLQPHSPRHAHRFAALARGALCARALRSRSVLPAPEEKASTRTPCSDLPTTEGKASMRMPPLDPEAAKGEHFHSLVDCAARPKIYVITDNTRAYPGLRECTRLHVLASPTTLA